MSESVDILCATDENYAAYCGVMLTSALENNREFHLRIYILVNSISRASEAKFRRLEEKYDCEVHLIVPDGRAFAECMVREGDHVSVAAYYRMAVGLLLPADVHRVIYLDCDILVNRGIGPLWHCELKDAWSGVVVDSYHVEARKRLGIDTVYFNSGMMLIDVDAFRTHKVAEKCFRLIAEEPDRIRMHDQDALNIVIGEHVKYLSTRWNMLSAFLKTDKTELQLDPELESHIRDVLAQNGDGLVIHFEFFPKPWQKWVMMPHPYTRLWMHYRKISFWPDARIHTAAPVGFKMRVIALRTLWRLGLKRKPQYYLV